MLQMQFLSHINAGMISSARMLLDSLRLTCWQVTIKSPSTRIRQQQTKTIYISRDFVLLSLVSWWYGCTCRDVGHAELFSGPRSVKGIKVISNSASQLDICDLLLLHNNYVSLLKQAVREAALYAPGPAHGAAQLQPKHALRLRRPARLASSSCGRHEYSRCTRQTTDRQTSDSIIA